MKSNEKEELFRVLLLVDKIEQDHTKQIEAGKKFFEVPLSHFTDEELPVYFESIQNTKYETVEQSFDYIAALNSKVSISQSLSSQTQLQIPTQSIVNTSIPCNSSVKKRDRQEESSSDTSKRVCIYVTSQTSQQPSQVNPPLQQHNCHQQSTIIDLANSQKVTSSSTKSSSSNMFQDLIFYFVAIGGTQLNHARAKILKQKVIERGAKVLDVWNPTENSSESYKVTHIILGSTLEKCVDYFKLDKAKSSILQNYTILTPDWISESISKGSRLNEELYRIIDSNCAKNITNSLEEKKVSSLEMLPSPQHSSSEEKQVEEEIVDEPKVTSLVEGARAEYMNARKHAFACQLDPSSALACPNKHLVQEFEKLEKIYKARGDTWRTYSYGKAVSILRRCKTPITSYADAIKLPNIGESIAKKIEELISNGSIAKLQALENDEQTKIVDLFTKVHGVGPKIAQQWYSNGYRSLEDVKQKEKLTKAQTIGFKYVEDFQKKIPRREVQIIEQIVSTLAKKIDSEIEWEVCGSYRRGATESGDVDLLFTHKKKIPVGFLKKLVDKLTEDGFLLDHLSMSYRLGEKKAPSTSSSSAAYCTGNEDDECDTYMGVCRVPSEITLASSETAEEPVHFARRIDFKVYEYEQWPFALLYFTGSAHFNRSMRLYSQKIGFSLDDKGLRKVVRLSKQKVHEGDRVPNIKDEKDIFTALGLDFKEPQERNV